MRFLITTNNYHPFLTNWYDYENTFIQDIGMTVYDLITSKFTTDGKAWIDIEIDHL